MLVSRRALFALSWLWKVHPKEASSLRAKTPVASETQRMVGQDFVHGPRLENMFSFSPNAPWDWNILLHVA